MFVDEVKVFARAGHGGKGCVAFLRETYRPKGGPSGGNGGRGGSVILKADHDLNNLVAQFYNSRLIAEGGEQGLGKGMDGISGKDLIVKVPCGTLVWSVENSPVGAGEDDAQAKSGTIQTATSNRPIIRHAGTERAMEIDLEQQSPEHNSTRKGE
jgi:GTP-binding protein